MMQSNKENHFKAMVIGGTIDSRQIIDRLLEKNIEVFATVATTYGESLLQERQGLQIFQGKMNETEIQKFIIEKGIDLVIDASHPFAENVSVNAINACENAEISYLRFERQSHSIEYSNCLMADTYKEAAIMASNIEGNIFLTTGSNNLDVFVENIPNFKEKLFVRVLPDSNVILKCEKLGLSASNIIAMKGPFSKKLNKEMLKTCNATVMVTKESGDAGGVCEKQLAADELGIQTIMIKRPKIQYQNVFRDIETLVEKVVTTFRS